MATVNIYGRKPVKRIREESASRGWKKINGFAHPLGKNTGRGYFNKKSGVDLVKNNLIQLLSTNKGERVMLPSFGINLDRYLFEPLDSFTIDQIKNDIFLTLAAYAPEVEVIDLSVTSSDLYGYQENGAIFIKLNARLTESGGEQFDMTIKVG